MFAPSGYNDWAGGTGATNITEPTDAEKAVGWATDEAPPSSYFNWLQRNQDRWIKYLTSRVDQFRTVTDDDFVLAVSLVNHAPASGLAPQGITGLMPRWDTPNLGNVNVNDYDPGKRPDGLGVVRIGLPGGPSDAPRDYYINQRIDGAALIARDWRMEMLLSNTTFCAAGQTAPQLVVGLQPYFSSGTYGYWFGATGPSSCWNFNFGSSAAPTSIGLSGYFPLSPSAWQKLAIEKAGPTMMVKINDAVLGTITPVAASTGVTGVLMPMDFGVRIRSPGWSGSLHRTYIEKIKLEVSDR